MNVGCLSAQLGGQPSDGKFNRVAVSGRPMAVLRAVRLLAEKPQSQAQGETSAVMTAHRRQDRISQWAVALRERSGGQKAVVALANARILWP